MTSQDELFVDVIISPGMNTFDYPGSAANFRAFMEGIINSHEESKWRVNDTDQLIITYEPSLCAVAREGWHIIPYKKQDDGSFKITQQRATMLALEVLPNTTVVYVHDGVIFEGANFHIRWEPIGDTLLPILDEILSRVFKQLTAKSFIPKKPETRDLDDWFDYSYMCKKMGMKITLRKIADETHYNYDYVRQRHVLYKTHKNF